MNNQSHKVIVIGASGYVGSRLVAILLEKGYSVRAVSRSLSNLQARPWVNHPEIELRQVDIFDLKSLQAACEDCDAAYYLVHSMNPHHRDFAKADRQAADNMVQAAKESRLKRIIYLSGLGNRKEKLSRHLRSRTEVSEILHSGKIPATTFRAAMVIGEGSVAFEILRLVANRSPVIIHSKWTRTPSQPIAIRNVLNYLVGCLKAPQTQGEVYDIGGTDIISYKQLLDLYMELAAIPKKLQISVPFMTPAMSGYWVCMTTPVSCSIARPLADGMKNVLVCGENRIRDIIPQELLTCREAIRRALHLAGNWTGDVACNLPPVEWKFPGDPSWVGMAKPGGK